MTQRMCNLFSTRISGNHMLEVFSQPKSRLSITRAIIPSKFATRCQCREIFEECRRVARPKLAVLSGHIGEMVLKHCSTDPGEPCVSMHRFDAHPRHD